MTLAELSPCIACGALKPDGVPCLDTLCPASVSAPPPPAPKKKARARQTRRDIYESLGMKKVHGALGGTYYE